MDDCIFCKIIKKEIPALIIDENESVIVFLSLENHPLIIPKKHIKDIYDLDDETGTSIMKEAIKISKAVKKGLACDGINLVQSNEPAAHQVVFHFHLHIKPRWYKDDVTLHWNADNVGEDILLQTLNKIKQSLP